MYQQSQNYCIKQCKKNKSNSLSFPQRNKSASSSYPLSLWTWHLWELKWWNNGLYINVIISGSTVKLKQTLHQRTTGERKWMKTKENCQYSADNLQMYNYVIAGPKWREKAHSWIFTVENRHTLYMYKVANWITHKLTFEEFLIHTSPWISIKIIIFWCTWLRNLWRRRTVYQSCGIFYMQQWLVQIQCLFMWSQSLDLHACCKSIYFYAIPYTQIHKCSYSKNKNERFIVSQC